MWSYGVHYLVVFSSAVPESIFQLDPLVLIMSHLHRNSASVEAVSFICLCSLAQQTYLKGLALCSQQNHLSG